MINLFNRIISIMSSICHSTPPVAVAGILRFFAGLVTWIVLLCAVCWLAVHLDVGVAVGVIHPIRDVFEGALDGGHQRLNGFQLL